MTRWSKRAETVPHRDVCEVRSPVVRNTRIDDAVSLRAVLVLLARAELRSRRCPRRIDGGDMDLVAWMLEVQKLGRNAGNWVILVRDVRKRVAELHDRDRLSQYLRHRIENRLALTV